MNKCIFFLIGFSFSICQLVIAQTGIKQTSSQKGFENIPTETTYVHYNSSLFFVGEYMYYRVYCLSDNNKKLSSLSKVAYVELVSQDKDLIFRHKVSLESGKGQGDFFIPTSIPSGNYKLICYTQWMRNYGINTLFQSDIVIVNPYQGDQKKILKEETASVLEEILDQSEVKSTEVSTVKNQETKKSPRKEKEVAVKMTLMELVDEDGKTVFRHEINFESEKGQSDFFVPSNIPSGNYKLKVYPQWVKSSGKEMVFQRDIVVEENGKGEEKEVRAVASNTKRVNKQNKNTKALADKNSITQVLKDALVSMELDSQKFNRREKVTLSLKKNNPSLEIYGSLSVRKIDTIAIPARLTTKKFEKWARGLSKRNLGVTSSSAFFLPELRGSLLSGKIKGVKPDLQLENKKVVLSVPGSSYDLKVATTDKDGVFYMNLDRPFVENEAYLQVLGDPTNFTIEIFGHSPLDYDTISFTSDFSISENMKQMILDRSVQNQISNGYFSAKPDTINLPKPQLPFYGGRLSGYNLDEFTRFPTVKETVVEIVDNVRTKEIGNENYIFQIKKEKPIFNGADFLPLVMVDGLMIQDHNDIVNFNANRVEKINFSREPYFMSSQIFQGVLDITTYNKDFYKSYNKSYLKKVELFLPEIRKNYFVQFYNDNNAEVSNHIPDFRQQLLWVPSVNFTDENLNIEFFTSDNPGIYEVCLEGFTKDGISVSAREILEVE